MHGHTHNFFGALGQLLTFAFPMVLGETTLTAVFLYYVTPFDLPFNFYMMMGAIASQQVERAAPPQGGDSPCPFVPLLLMARSLLVVLAVLLSPGAHLG